MTAYSGRRAKSVLFFVRILAYVTNHVISSIPSYGIRHAWYRLLGVQIGPASGVHMGCFLWFYGPGHIRRTGVTIGRNTRINRRCCLDIRGPLSIGDNVSVSPEVVILTTQHAWRLPGFPLESRPVVIEDHVWIGMRAIILPGASLGRGAVVAAGAVVSGSVAPGSVVSGVPARQVAARPETALEYVLDAPLPRFE
jgi:acetyltransferase-like isoleucine patch superfamily enzyme